MYEVGKLYLVDSKQLTDVFELLTASIIRTMQYCKEGIKEISTICMAHLCLVFSISVTNC